VPCLFCEEDFDEAAGRKRTREHVYGDWMRPHLEDVIGPGTHTRTKSTFEDLEADKRTYRGFPAQQTVQGVCEVCNNGWLSDVQAAARPTLLPLFTKPRRRVVGVEAQRALVVVPQNVVHPGLLEGWGCEPPRSRRTPDEDPR
jgi:hypothetical protein